MASAFALAGIAAGQNRPSHPKVTVSKKSLQDTKPISNAEARQVLSRMDALLWKALELKVPVPSPTLPLNSQPVSRSAIVRELSKSFSAIKPEVKFTPPAVVFSEGSLSFSDKPTKTQAIELIRWGLLAKVGPIVTGKSTNLSVAEFGDSVGFFVARICDITHVPAARWTPYLGGGRG